MSGPNKHFTLHINKSAYLHVCKIDMCFSIIPAWATRLTFPLTEENQILEILRFHKIV